MSSLKKYTLAFALFITLALNGSLSLYLHPLFGFNNGANLLLPIGMMLVALIDDINQKELWLAFGTGIVSDIFFFGIIGVYTVSLPCVCWLLQKGARFLPELFWARAIFTLIGTIFLNVYNWLFFNLTGIAKVSLGMLIKGLLPTLLWSAAFIILTYWIWNWLAIEFPFMVKQENYRS